jgi:hypothetical protein
VFAPHHRIEQRQREVASTPRRKVRRGKCFLVMIIPVPNI